MNREIQSIISNLQNVLTGEAWYGRPVYQILEETEPQKAYLKPNQNSHSAIELLYHMLTWADFTMKRLEGYKEDMAEFEKLDWRTIDPATHTWQKGLTELKATHNRIIELLQQKDDSFLKEIVDYRKYNFHFLLNGLIQHNIYHLGQIVYINKFLS
jgi:uncharacterized damage-inducible protein DinB